ncbi:hypothetical protein CSB08_01070 [Candidatus Gracilibacteria bacterium]|nr:MAG: hypothetical protein CSB08_01070 [Candidatus Gracilibacteria bacterium]
MKKFVKFFLLGGFTYSVNIGITYLLINNFGLSAHFSYFVSLGLITIVNFIMSLKVIFKNYFSIILLIKYSISLLSFSLINYLLVYILSYYFPSYYFFIIFLVTSFVFLLKFFVYDKLVFKNYKVDNKTT